MVLGTPTHGMPYSSDRGAATPSVSSPPMVIRESIPYVARLSLIRRTP